jgi:hypothetical protein
MAPATSITDVCPSRAAHGALVVRLVHVIPAANAGRPLKPIAPNRKHARGPSYKYRKSPSCHKCARTAPGLAHTCVEHTTRARKMQSDGNARTQAHARSQRHACTDVRTRTRARACANPSANAHTGIHFTHRRARTHTARHTHTFITRTRRRTHTHTNVPSDMHEIRVCKALHRQIHLYILCRESDANKIRTECGACVRACMRASVWVCARACARAETSVSLSRVNGRLQACARV